MQRAVAAGAAALSLALSPAAVGGLRQERALRADARASAGSELRSRSRGGVGGDAPAWDYGDHGKSWSMGQCCAGAGQSPINVTAAAAHSSSAAHPKAFFYRYDRYYSPIRMTNDGRVLSGVLQGEPGSAGGFGVGEYYPNKLDAEYYLWKFEIHAPSEHTFGGNKADLEVQLFHRPKGATEAEDEKPGHTVVVSLGFFGSLHPSPILDALREGGLPREAGAETIVNGHAPGYLDLSAAFRPNVGVGTASAEKEGKKDGVSGQQGVAMADAEEGKTLTYLGNQATYWQYSGSLTAPPCRTGVTWFVRSAPLPVNVHTLDAYRDAIRNSYGLQQADHAGNDRALQPSCGVQLTSWMAESAFQFPAPEEGESNNAAFERAQAENAGNENAFAESLGSTQEAAKDRAQQAKSDFQRCRLELTRTKVSLSEAERQKQAECAGAQAATAHYQSVKTEHSLALSNTQKAQCLSVTRVAEALHVQLAAQEQNCKALEQASQEANDSASK